MNRRARFLARNPREPYTGAPEPEPEVRKPEPPFWMRPVTWGGLIVFQIISAPFVGFGRALAQWMLS
jgi:hypothetical protein